jgi:ABC-type phosphonate transport system ATPase subunit
MANESYKIILDSPASNPALGFGNVADALKDIIEGSRPQFAIGIFGTWGSGKTTLMQAIEKRLDPAKTIAVEFSAWRYEKEQHLIVPLLDTIRERLVKWSEDNEQFKEQAVRTAATVGKAIYSLLAGMSLKVGIPKALEISFDANKALERADAFDKSKKEAETPRSFYHATFKALSQAFAEFLGPESGRRIVVFIDDLDRCLPQGALEVLEAMKLFFDLEGFVFVVGLDQAVVERTIDLKYKGDSTEGAYQIRGADYIKKIFQLPYAVAPVAVAQLDEFLEAVYAEGGLGVEQKNDLKHIVTPHLRYLVTDSGINPREIKRFVNAYTLIMKIKGYLEKDACLALLTLAFRRDWEVARRALLSYRTVFTDAVSRQLAGNSTAIVDLDSTFAGVPESFLSYVTAPNPGAKLLSLPNLDEYIYTGEATTGTQGSVFVDAIRDVANVTTTLRLLEAAPATQDSTQYSNYSSAVLTALSKVKSLSYGRLDRIIQTWTDHLNSFMTATKPDPDTRRKTWIDEEEAIRRRFMNQLMELYQAGTTSIASSTPA